MQRHLLHSPLSSLPPNRPTRRHSHCSCTSPRPTIESLGHAPATPAAGHRPARPFPRHCCCDSLPAPTRAAAPFVVESPASGRFESLPTHLPLRHRQRSGPPSASSNTITGSIKSKQYNYGTVSRTATHPQARTLANVIQQGTAHIRSCGRSRLDVGHGPLRGRVHDGWHLHRWGRWWRWRRRWRWRRDRLRHLRDVVVLRHRWRGTSRGWSPHSWRRLLRRVLDDSGGGWRRGRRHTSSVGPVIVARGNGRWWPALRCVRGHGIRLTLRLGGHFLQHIVRLHKLVDEVARLSVVQLALGDARLLQEGPQRLHLVTSQVEALLLVPANVHDVLEVCRRRNVRLVDLANCASRSAATAHRRSLVHGHVERGCHVGGRHFYRGRGAEEKQSDCG